MKILVIGLDIYCGGHFYFGSKAKYQKKTTELPQATDKVASKFFFVHIDTHNIGESP
jgi:hypothetical protein